MYESVVYKIRLECDECGSTVFLSGPSLEVTCQTCWSKRAIGQQLWKALIVEGFSNYSELAASGAPHFRRLSADGLQFVQQFAAETPRCRACQVSLDLSLALADPGVTVHCTACGAGFGTDAPPDWLYSSLPLARLLVGVYSAQTPEAVTAKPVLMSCMNCGAKLEIDSVSQRITSCAYCEADHYLPEDLWRRLHPAQRRVPWYLVCAARKR